VKALFIGGTGNISTSVSKLAVERGIELYLLNRGQRVVEIPGAHALIGDIHRPEQVRQALRGLQFDAVVDWIAYTASDIERDIALFRDQTEQYVFPLCNPYWAYSRNKIECEEQLLRAYRDEGFPMTVVRPSLTYDTVFPIAIGGWGCYTLADRLLKGRSIIVHGDGTSLWVVTHAKDFAVGFVGLLGNPQALGHAFHITSDEVLTWDQIYRTIAAALGVEAHIVHMPTDFIAKVKPDMGPGLLGDKAWSVVFDNTKIKTFVPVFQATIPFHTGIHRTLAWFDEDERRKRIDDAVNQTMDDLLAVYGKMAKE
jgi:nucleoside-diphosphate-sugar epimerase